MGCLGQWIPLGFTVFGLAIPDGWQARYGAVERGVGRPAEQEWLEVRTGSRYCSRTGSDARRMGPMRRVDLARWVSTSLGVPHGLDRWGRSILGELGGALVIRVEARQTKALTMPNCLRCAGRLWGN